MESGLTREILVSRDRTKRETQLVRNFVKNVDPAILNIRKRVSSTDSDTIPAILGDVQDGYSPIILICGRQRKGKTRFGATLGNLFSIFLYYEWLDPKKSFFLYPKDLLKAIEDEGYGIFILDEAGSSGSGLNKREWFGELNELFDYVLQTQGNLNNIYIFILPFASDLTTDVRKYVDFMMAAKKRGVFKSYKIYKKEDQLVKNLKDFRQVFIELLFFKAGDLPKSIWDPIEKRCNEVKAETRKEKLNRLFKDKGDFLSG